MYCVTRDIKGNLYDVTLQRNGQQKTATRFATLLHNESNTDVARFVTHFRTLLLTNEGLFSLVVKSATSLFNSFCSNLAKKVARFLLPFLSYLTAPPSLRQENENENENENKGYYDKEHENGNENEDEDEDESKNEHEDEDEKEYEYEYENEN